MNEPTQASTSATGGTIEKAWQLPGSEIAARLDTDAGVGLTSAEVAERLDKYGPNELDDSEQETRWQRFLKQFKDPLVSLLFVAIAISLFAWLLEGAQGAPVDAIVIAVIVLANAILGYAQESKAADAVAALSSMTAATSTVIRNGHRERIPSSELVPGDILLLEEGDAVGADGRLLEATNLRIQEASLTGESVAVDKQVERLEGEPPLAERDNCVYNGTGVVEGVGRAVVTATGMQTEMGAIASLLDETEQDESPLKREINLISKWLGISVVAIAIVVMAVLLIVSDLQSPSDYVEILVLGVSLAVAAVPEGLPAILSLVLAIGVQALARRNAVMKDLHSVETLGAASVICSDKTGTLTRNEMTLTSVVSASGKVELSGTGYDPTEGSVVERTSEQAQSEAEFTVLIGAVANNSQLDREESGWEILGDPTEAAFLVAWPKFEAHRAMPGERDAEVPFSSERKRMSVIVDGRMYTKGAPDIILDLCSHELVGQERRELTQARRDEISQAVIDLSAKGMRTLGTAFKDVGERAEFTEADESALCFAGFVGIIDPPREEAKQAIAEAHGAGIRTVMITGDHPVTAASIAEQLGVSANDRVATGAEIDAMTAEERKDVAHEVDVYARVAPEHKLRLVDALQRDGHIVAMTGDGVNDAPAVKSADIGVAMGVTGTEVTKEAARMILADDNYATIVDAVKRGRVVFDNIQKFLRYLLSSNMGEVCTVFFGVVLAGVIGLTDPNSTGVVLPLLATQVLWINLVTDSGPALALGLDPADGDVMKRKPRSLNDHVIDRAMWQRVIFIGLVMGAITLLTIDMFLPGGLIEGSDSLDVARTAGFTTLVLAQLFNVFNSRSAHESAFTNLFTNGWLWASVALGFVLQIAVVHVPFMQVAFGTASLDLQHWLIAIAMGSIVLWAEELMKVIYRALRAMRRAREELAAGK
ncbi:cation-translocating P-type ATPase [Gulosibacter molinativorax]|uniref:cation-translocating P-type ATPase n=1 Tax=Gulosibacter molinativorax TaxID=256821 RepID=UPI001FE20526|nr:HAD-IC family P-type ATPase [Gulosibacter molinativorax]